MAEGNTGFIELRDMRERLTFIALRQIYRCFTRPSDAHHAAEWSILLMRFYRFSGTDYELYEKYSQYSDAYNVTHENG